MKVSLLALCLLAAAPFAPAADTSKEQAAAGAQLFASSGCTHCHGDKLQGNDIGPSLTTVGRKRTPERIAGQIHNGGGAMPAFGDVLTGDQVAQLVAFLETQRAKPPRAKAAHAAGAGH